MPYGCCEACARLYVTDREVLAATLCPHCSHPVRPVAEDEGLQRFERLEQLFVLSVSRAIPRLEEE